MAHNKQRKTLYSSYGRSDRGCAFTGFRALFLGNEGPVDGFHLAIHERTTPGMVLLYPFHLDYADVGTVRRPAGQRRADTIKGVAGTAAISTIIYLFVFFIQNPIRCPGAAWLDLLSPPQS
jgi:hypothetical protein